MSSTVVFIFSLRRGGAAFAKEQVNCPVMGGNTDDELFHVFSPFKIKIIIFKCLKIIRFRLKNSFTHNNF